MKKQLYLMRHGETLFNVLGKVQGACDSPLTNKGKMQAKQAATFFQENQIHFDHYYSSTQERACDTLEIITNSNHFYQRKKGLKEMNFGRFEGESSELQPKGSHNFETFYEQFGGETARDVQKRICHTLLSIMEQEDHQKVLAVSHNGACFYFLNSIWKHSDRKIPTYFPNCAIFIYTYEKYQFDLTDIIDPSSKKSIL
ncbi:hypothetical protein UAW_00054 [Enterococcus haemoperoxidus ATCC BAA-382]|uniref:Phosphoglycerate mutase n=1 Tax=Enterococcus haemoperoxidus ATCC BAA-382 TaxID=1158608 RepID=R2TL00_9ENTE|nr:histidine phosphatase family protein [Enterococcus haemoperoxidus]EOI00787.1 hypothetical protein UAW_00054 [Enterococcus haemoperoxidus ATCC BAA-382]EOT62021.1 hypothetical protein I583_01021 [Enterococcus haemoperoxidus ATCC BAA-382]OJG52085.1 hypothetical protein RV06_GL001100 [Enterococcus haemoperoxidus]